MAVTFDAASNPAAVTATSLTFPHACAANASLGVGATCFVNSGATGVTYNGVAMTLEIGLTIAVGDTAEIWKLDAAEVGTNNVVITYGSSRNIIGGAISAVGADLTDCSLASASASGTSTAPSVNVTSVAGDLVMSVCLSDADVTHAPGANETERWDTLGAARASGTTESPAGTTATMSRTLGSSIEWGIVAMSFRAAAAAGASLVIPRHPMAHMLVR